MNPHALSSATDLIQAPLLYKGKVRELYDLGEQLLIVVTDRISAFDYVLEPPVPGKGKVLNQLSAYWFEQTAHLQPNHVLHTDVERLGGTIRDEDKDKLRGRIMVSRKAKRIDVECIVRGYLTGGGWRSYTATGEINGVQLPPGLRKNERLPEPIFTPATKNDVGHDEDITFAELEHQVGRALAAELRQRSLRLYHFAHEACERQGILLADCKFEFGLVGGEVILIDELFTPDCSRFWAKEHYQLDIEIDSMDKEPVRQYLLSSGWDHSGPPDPLPQPVIIQTARRYNEIFTRLTAAKSCTIQHGQTQHAKHAMNSAAKKAT